MNVESRSSVLLAPVSLSTCIAIALLALSWFGLACLVTTFGPVQQVMHFYDLGTVLRDPSWLVHGIGPNHTAEAFAFGTLSVAILFAPLAAHRMTTRAAWLLYTLPLILIVVCGILLYRKTSQPYVEMNSDTGAIGAFIARVANDMAGRAGDTIAQHISIGAGGYLSVIAAVWLAYSGIRLFNAPFKPAPAIGSSNEI